MSAAEIVAAVAAGCVVVLGGAMIVTLLVLRRTLADARDAVDHLHRRAVPALDDMRRAVRRAERDVGRLDDLIDTAGSIGRTADAASRLAYESVSSPIIKALAFGAGTRRAARRLRGLDGSYGSYGSDERDGSDGRDRSGDARDRSGDARDRSGDARGAGRHEGRSGSRRAAGGRR